MAGHHPMQPSLRQPEESARSDEKEKKMQKWFEDNEEAIGKYNERIEKEGTFAESDGILFDN